MMVPRIAEAHRILNETGSIFVHCDPAASHYLKIALDTLFGARNFRNEIVWRRTHAHSSSRRFGPVHDTVLFYSKSERYSWNPVFTPYSQAYLADHFRSEDGGGRYQLITCTGPGDRVGTLAHYEWNGQLPPAGRHWAWKRERMEELDRAGRIVTSSNGIPRLKVYAHEGKGVALQDVWDDISRLDAHSDERVGYDTQKPVALLERIIRASTSPGDLVVDPFAGSGTTAVAAERLGRSWRVFDSSLLAGSIALGRVRQAAGTAPIELVGFPSDVTAARRLRAESPTTFGVWGTSMLGTVVDRERSTQSVTSGLGNLGKTAVSSLRSWVPLDPPTAVMSVSPDHTSGEKVGVLLMDRAGSAVPERITARFGGVKLVVAHLSELVSRRAANRGFADTPLPNVPA
jgi:site-specific DNA-methyltransferase (adenine-specific)